MSEIEPEYVVLKPKSIYIKYFEIAFQWKIHFKLKINVLSKHILSFLVYVLCIETNISIFRFKYACYASHYEIRFALSTTAILY